MNTRKIGTEKEQIAREYLERNGMRILETNYRAGKGEIDLIGYHGNCLVFVEVKYRKNLGRGSAHEAVTQTKQRQICKVADYYRYTHRWGAEVCVRYDVVAIEGNEIDWIQNAFSHIGHYL